MLRASDAVAKAAKKMVSDRGEKAVVQLLGVHPATLARLMGGLPVQHSTMIAAAAQLGVDLRGMVAGPEGKD